MITPPEINHLQEPDWNCTGRCRREAFRMVDNRRPWKPNVGCIMEQMEQPEEACLSLCREIFWNS